MSFRLQRYNEEEITRLLYVKHFGYGPNLNYGYVYNLFMGDDFIGYTVFKIVDKEAHLFWLYVFGNGKKYMQPLEQNLKQKVRIVLSWLLLWIRPSGWRRQLDG